MTKVKMVASAKKVLASVMGLKQQDRVLIITDEETKDIADSFSKAAAKICSRKPIIYQLNEDDRPLYALPSDLARKMDSFIGKKVKGSMIFINAFEGYLEETPFRLQLIRKQRSERSRVGHAPGITKKMMLDGSLTADYGAIMRSAQALMKAFKNVVSVQLTGPGGTDLAFRIDNRPFETDVEIPDGQIGNLPAGEIWCAPEETSANGVYICDGSIGDIGSVKDPITIKISKGKAVSLKCEDKAFGERVLKAISLDEMSNVIGEFGIGLNPEAKLTGNLLEDEKAGGTAHIAFGNNIDMPGGRNNSKTHRDFLMYKPTIAVRYKDGTTAILIKNGKVNI